MTRAGLVSWLVALLAVLSVSPAPAAVFSGDPNNYRRLLRDLKPGDTLRLIAGEYHRGLPVHNLHGKPGKPITITGPSGLGEAVILGYPNRNTISIKDASHITIRDLEIDGRGAFVDGVKCEGHARYAHHITLQGLRIHSLARRQQSVGISTKCPAWDWVVRGNHIEGVGTGMYFGDSDGSDPFVGGIIEDNDVINTIGYNLQVKHQRSRPTIDGMPRDTRMTLIRRNRFVKAEGGATEVNARPNVLVGHFPISGPGSDDTYAIYGNLFFQNPHEALFQGEGNVALYSNVFFNSHQNEFPAVAIQPHNDIPRRVRVVFNTIVHPGVGVRLLQREERRVDHQFVAGNIVFAGRPVNGFSRAENFTGAFEDAPTYLQAPIPELDRFSAEPRSWNLGTEREVRISEDYPDLDKDFAGRARRAHGVGAFAGSL